MSRLILLVLALGLGLWGILTARDLWRAAPARRNSRAGYFAEAATVLSDIRQRIEPTGFARLAGKHHGLSFDLQALPDTLTFRKLPALWVMVTLTEPQDLGGETHIMARATGQESFSTYPAMPVEANLPPGFAATCSLRCSDRNALPPPAQMARLAALFADPRLKEVVLGPRGLRLVVLAEEAQRTNYLLFRDAELGAAPFAASRLLALVTTLAELHAPARARVMTKPPPQPYLVLATAILLPGCGQVLNRQPLRGLMFLFFTGLLGGITLVTAPPQASLIGHLAGGIFVYALSIPDAYRTARLRWAIWQKRQI